MKKKNILVVGNADSIWIIKMIKNVYSKLGGNITIITDSNRVYVDFYKDAGIKVHEISCNKIFMKIPGIRKAVYRNAMWKAVNQEKFDVTHIHFMNVNNAWLASKIKNKYKCTVIASYWGSDLLDTDLKYLSKEFKYLNKIDAVTVSTKHMYNYILENIRKYKPNNIEIVKFGVDILPLIDAYKERIIDAKEKKIIVAIGYNGRRRQNHLEVIESLKDLPKEKKNKLCFVIQMSYAVDDGEYRAEIESAFVKNGMEFRIIDKSLNDNEVARLRNQVDIFIHAQKTDAFAASVMEYLYSNTYVINPCWIKYEELDAIHVKYYSYESYSELPQIILKILDEKPDCLHGNKQKIYNLVSWEKVAKKWLSVMN